MWAAEDLQDMIDSDLPGYALASLADQTTVAGLFRNPSAEAFGIAAGSRPSFLVVEATAPAIDAAITINGGAYVVAESHPDGLGFSRLTLESA